MKFKAPTTLCLSGVTQSGKTTWIKKLIEYKKDMFDVPPTKIVYCYGVWQPAFVGMKDVLFHKDLPSASDIETYADGSHVMLVLDDLMDSVVKSEEAQRLFVRGSHHKNMTVLYVTQNMFYQGKCARTISLNCHYLVLFKNPRDHSQIQYLGRQIGLNKSLPEAYEDCMKEKFGYLVVDLHPHSIEGPKLFSHVFPYESLVSYVPL